MKAYLAIFYHLMKKERNLNPIPLQFKKNGLLCRWVVLEMLGQILVEKRLISDLKENQKFPFWHLIPEQKARSLSLLETILRNLSVIDNIIKLYLRQETRIRIINILRIAAAEILFDKIAIHAAVDSAVRLTKTDKKSFRFSGLVNAICRKITTRLADNSRLEDPLLNNEFVIDLNKTYNINIIRKFGLAQKLRPPLDLTIKDDCRLKYYASLLKGNLLPSGTIRLEHNRQVTKLPGYAEGDWWVQDFSASIPIRLLGSVKGLDALDVCAAPGGKTLQLVSGGAHVTALDISTKRAAVLRANLNRTKLLANVVNEDVQKFEVKNLFDIVLVDAPCSATGTIRRNCDLQYLNPYKRIRSLVSQQKAIFKRAMLFVKPGGRLVYCTCSLAPAEGESVVSEIVKNSSNWSQVFINAESLGINSEWVDSYGGLRLRPDYWSAIGGMDGFYIAILRREN